MSRLIGTCLLALAVVAALALPVLPCLDSPAAGRLRAGVQSMGRLICHQRADRSFSTCGRQWAVCGRCSGLYLGAGVGVLLAGFGIGRGVTWRQWEVALATVAAPTAVLWALEMAGLIDPGNAVRFAVALPPGVVTALWLSAVARGELR